MKPGSPRLWIALTRPDNLVNALAVALAGRGRFTSCRLLYENSSWWDQVDWKNCPALFDEIIPLEKVPTCRGLRDLPRFYRALQHRQQRLAELGIAPPDLIVTLSGITRLSNALASAYPGVRKLLCTTVKKYVDASRPWSFSRYRHTTSGWLQTHVVEPRVGLRPTLHLKPWRGGGDGVRLQRPQAPLETLFEAILLLSNDGTELPPCVGPNVRPAPFPSLHDLGGDLPRVEPAQGTGREIVFFGSPFLLVRNLSPAVYREHLDACLDYLRRCYGSEHALVYRPHPSETREAQQLDLREFVIEADRQVAELYFLRNFRRIEAVFSVSSTVSRVALNYGLNGYTFWRCFPFDATAGEYFGSLMGRVPPEFDLRTLTERPITYARPPEAGTFLEAIDSEFAWLDGGTGRQRQMGRLGEPSLP